MHRHPLPEALLSVRGSFLRFGLAMALLFALSLVACGPQETAVVTGEGPPETRSPAGLVTRLVERITIVTRTPDPVAVAAAAREPVELDISLTGELPDLDPNRAESQAQLDLAQNLFIGLTNYDGATDTIAPELATSWSVSPDGRTWTFNLRDDVYWVRPASPLPGSAAPLWSVQPIRPVTADDVVFALQRLCARDVDSPLAFTLFIIDGCEQAFVSLEPSDADRAAVGARAVDPTTLEISLTRPAGYFLTLTSMPYFQPVPRDLVTEQGDEWLDAAGNLSSGWQTPGKLVTSGPYFPVPTETTSLNMVLHRNPLWPLAKSGNADVVNIVFLDEEDAFDLWQSRKLDLAPLPAAEREAFLKRSPDKVRLIPDEVLFYVGYNFGSQVFREPEVRRAFSAAIDRQALIDELYAGGALAMRHATVPGVIGTSPVGEVGVGYSPDYARQQMAASTFRTCRLLPVIRMVVSSADLSLRQAELIRDMWVEELGCSPENIQIEQAQFGELLAATRPDAIGRPDLWELAWAPTFPDAHNLLDDLLHCEDSENRQTRDCSEADTLLRRAAVATDPAERAQLYRQAESLFFSESGVFPIAPLYVRTREWIIQNWVTFTPIAFGGQQWDGIVLDAVLKELQQSR